MPSSRNGSSSLTEITCGGRPVRSSAAGVVRPRQRIAWRAGRPGRRSRPSPPSRRARGSSRRSRAATAAPAVDRRRDPRCTGTARTHRRSRRDVPSRSGLQRGGERRGCRRPTHPRPTIAETPSSFAVGVHPQQRRRAVVEPGRERVRPERATRVAELDTDDDHPCAPPARRASARTGASAAASRSPSRHRAGAGSPAPRRGRSPADGCSSLIALPSTPSIVSTLRSTPVTSVQVRRRA